jgi:hypothetical protein
MTANLEPVAVLPQVIGVVDHPCGEPEHLALEVAEHCQLLVMSHATVLLRSESIAKSRGIALKYVLSEQGYWHVVPPVS